MLGVILSVIGLITLILRADEAWRTVAFTIYGLSLVVLYLASTLYHGLNVSAHTQDRLRRFDHLAIFLLIAGSYTPICLMMAGAWGWSLLGIVWTLALGGVALKIFAAHLPSWLSASIYLGLGWLAVVALGPITQTFPPRALFWLFGGGMAYTIGAVIYALERPDPYPEVFGHHGIFHIFVLAGSALHFVFMIGYVA